MLKDAKVVTSKFLQLKDKLNNSIRDNRGYDNSIMRATGTSEVTCNILELQTAFGELCELLHELVIEENDTIIPKEECEAEWKYWAGWSGNHDKRIEDATCSKCGYKHSTVRGNPDMLQDYCPCCKSKMKKQ